MSICGPGIVMHTYNLSTWGTEVGRALESKSSRTACQYNKVLSQEQSKTSMGICLGLVLFVVHKIQPKTSYSTTAEQMFYRCTLHPPLMGCIFIRKSDTLKRRTSKRSSLLQEHHDINCSMRLLLVLQPQEKNKNTV